MRLQISRPKRLASALAVSLGIHLFAAILFPIWPLTQSGGRAPVETLSFARVIHVSLRRHAEPRPLPAALPNTSRRAPKVSFERKHSELSAKNRNPHSRPTPVNGPQGSVAAAPRRVALQPAPFAARAVAPAAQQVVEPRAPRPSPNPQGTSETAVTGTSSSDRGGVSPFGASQPPVLDPRVKSMLQQRFAVHVTLLVTVGDDGRTKSIVFKPPLDDQTERAIRNVLAEASWDPAVCGGGISCEDVAVIRL